MAPRNSDNSTAIAAVRAAVEEALDATPRAQWAEVVEALIAEVRRVHHERRAALRAEPVDIKRLIG